METEATEDHQAQLEIRALLAILATRDPRAREDTGDRKETGDLQDKMVVLANLGRKVQGDHLDHVETLVYLVHLVFLESLVSQEIKGLREM